VKNNVVGKRGGKSENGKKKTELYAKKNKSFSSFKGRIGNRGRKRGEITTEKSLRIKKGRKEKRRHRGTRSP